MPPPDEAPAQDPPVTVFFDGDCPICAREVTFMRGLDAENRLVFVDAARADLPAEERRRLLGRFHVRLADGRELSGAAGFAAVWRNLPALRLLGRAAAWPPLLRLLEVFYLGFLRVRPSLQRLVRRRGPKRA